LITGYNTDVEYDGTVYHVQTEDKGVEHPIILSLVYVDGAILASKRSPYDDLIAGVFDEEILTQRLQRQHKLICAAVRAGRIEELKRMGERSSQSQSPSTPAAPITPTEKQPDRVPFQPVAAADRVEVTKTEEVRSAPAAVEEDVPLQVTLLEDPELRSGKPVTLRVLVTRSASNAREPLPGINISLKMLGTKFRPESKAATTDSEGIASFSVLPPKFTSGRAAILIRVDADGEVAELRRIILPESLSP
jgi:hypothetical protein